MPVNKTELSTKVATNSLSRCLNNFSLHSCYHNVENVKDLFSICNKQNTYINITLIILLYS